MKRRLQRIYWTGIAMTLIMALAAMTLVVKMKIDDTRKDLTDVLGTASEWALASNDDLQSLADAIASVSAPIRVTFLMEQGLVLADSEQSAAEIGNQGGQPEIREARQTGRGESLRLSGSGATFALYAAKRISPQLILRLSYPVQEITRLALMYGLGLTVLFLALFVVQRRAISRFAGSMMSQMEGVRRLLQGDEARVAAEFPEFQPALDNISYLAQRLKTDREEVLRTLNLRSDFVANASHELRSPLTSVMGFAEMLDEGMADTPEEQAMCVQMIRSECQRMLDVIEDILRLSKAERAALPDAASVNVAAVAAEICQALAPRAAQKQISLHVEGDLTVQAVEKDIWEILYNLTDNAVRYGKVGGSVRIRLSEGCIAVEDDGIGIAPEYLSRVFEQFYRVDESRDATVGGTGLGLSIVQAIVRRCGGDISVTSAPGEGSCFTVRFSEKEG